MILVVRRNDVHFESYSAVCEALAPLGLVGQQKNSDQLVISAQRESVWPDHGNSFWLLATFSGWIGALLTY